MARLACALERRAQSPGGPDVERVTLVADHPAETSEIWSAADAAELGKSFCLAGNAEFAFQVSSGGESVEQGRRSRCGIVATYRVLVSHS